MAEGLQHNSQHLLERECVGEQSNDSPIYVGGRAERQPEEQATCRPQPGNREKSSKQCAFCERTFKTPNGRGQHERHAHPAEANSRREPKALKAAMGGKGVKWTEAEFQTLAEAEARITAAETRLMQKDIDKRLAAEPDVTRTADAIHKARQKPAYKALLAVAREKLKARQQPPRPTVDRRAEERPAQRQERVVPVSVASKAKGKTPAGQARGTNKPQTKETQAEPRVSTQKAKTAKAGKQTDQACGSSLDVTEKGEVSAGPEASGGDSSETGRLRTRAARAEARAQAVGESDRGSSVTIPDYDNPTIPCGPASGSGRAANTPDVEAPVSSHDQDEPDERALANAERATDRAQSEGRRNLTTSAIGPMEPRVLLEKVDAPGKLISKPSIRVALRTVVELCSADMKALVEDALSDKGTKAEIEARMDRFVEGLSTTSRKKRRNGPQKKGRAAPKGNRHSERAQRFALTQRAYEQNPSHCARMILDGADTPKEHPPLEEVEEFYEKLFETPSDLPWPEGETSGQVDMSYGITVAELKKSLGRLNDSAAGPDGINRKHLRAANVYDLVAFSNIVFGSCIVPSSLRKNRTTLLPKKGDMTKVGNWRPVTVSSLLLRLIHKIIAARITKHVPLHHSQRGFTPQDGIMANTQLLQALIQEQRRKGKSLYLVSIDLAKAFDKVSPQAIRRALLRLGVDAHTMKYVESIYEDIETTISVGSVTTRTMKVRRGVKQGDPTSGGLFNMIMDELLTLLEEAHGLLLGGTRVAGIGFADDTVLVSDSVHGMRRHLRVLEEFLRCTNMEVNPAKCLALQLGAVSDAKSMKSTILTRPLFQIGGVDVPCMNAETQLGYLGLQYDYRGSVAPSAANITVLLERLRLAALRPWQKMEILRTYLLPRLVHSLQTPKVRAGKLRWIDRCVLRFVKTTTHLPVTAPSAVAYAKQSKGGFGLPCFWRFIPTLYGQRLAKLEASTDPQLACLARTQTIKGLQQRLLKMSGGMDTMKQYHDQMAINLASTALGSGLVSTSSAAKCTWLYEPPKSWTGRDYCSAAQLRVGLLPTNGAPYKKAEDAKCRNPPCRNRGERESLYHVLQRCPQTHWARIERHNAICKVLASDFSRNGYQVLSEPHYRVGQKLYKPDLVIQKRGTKTAMLVEVTVAFEHKNSLASAYFLKEEKYKPILSTIQKSLLVEEVKNLPIVVGARGGFFPKSYKHLKDILGDAARTARGLVHTSLRYGCGIHKQFNASVWR